MPKTKHIAVLSDAVPISITKLLDNLYILTICFFVQVLVFKILYFLSRKSSTIFLHLDSYSYFIITSTNSCRRYFFPNRVISVSSDFIIIPNNFSSNRPFAVHLLPCLSFFLYYFPAAHLEIFKVVLLVGFP